jgi:hypothetical protein
MSMLASRAGHRACARTETVVVVRTAGTRMPRPHSAVLRLWFFRAIVGMFAAERISQSGQSPLVLRPRHLTECKYGMQRGGDWKRTGRPERRSETRLADSGIPCRVRSEREFQ